MEPDTVNTNNNSTANAESTDANLDLREAAINLGLKPMIAYIPDKAAKKDPTASAVRTKRSRERAEAQGLKQISIKLPIELHEKVKEFSKFACSGESLDKAWSNLTAGQSCDFQMNPSGYTLLQWNSLLQSLPAWRRWIIKLITRDIYPANETEQEK